MDSSTLEDSSSSRSNNSTYPSPSISLWGHLLHKKPHTALAAKVSTTKPDALPPIGPVDKAGTSMRILLHDTQAVLEKFSGRVDKLYGEVENAKKEVATSHRIFQHGHEKLITDQVDLVNRCQTQLQKSIGKPAQSSSVDELSRDIHSMSKVLEGLDRRVDALHMLNQTQLQALQVLQEQQGKLLTMLSPLVPLIEAIPLHLDAAKHDINDSVRDVKILSTTVQETMINMKSDLSASLSFALDHTPRPAPPLSPLSSPSPLIRKRRRITEHSGGSSPSKIARKSSHHTKMLQDDVNQPILDPSQGVSSCNALGSHEGTQTLVPDESYASALSFSEPLSASDGSVAPYTSDLALLHSQEAQSIDSEHLAPSASAENPVLSASGSLPLPPIMIPGLASSVENLLPDIARSSVVPPFLVSSTSRTPVPIETSALSARLSSAPEAACQLPQVVEVERSTLALDTIRLSRLTPSLDSRSRDMATSNALASSPPPSETVTASSRPAKPMSLKDRRAREPLTDCSTRNAGKRFILVDDLDEDELEGDVI